MAIALVAHVSRATNGTSSGIDTTGSTLLVAVVGWTTGNNCVPVLSDSKSNKWQQVFMGHSENTTGLVGIWVVQNPSVGSSHTFTLASDSSGNSFPSGCFAGFSGVSTTFCVDQTVSTGTASATSLQAGSLTPSVANCLIISGLAFRVAATVSIDSSFTITDQVAFSAGVQVGSALAYLIETSIAAKNPSWSWTGAAIACAINIDFRPSFSSIGGAFTFA